MIDLYLLRLRYEILNVSIVDIANEVGLLTSNLEREAQENNWEQWWPTLEDLKRAIPVPELELEDDLTLSPLEEGANLYTKEAKVRLQVFHLAKDIHLSYKYAAFESALVDKASSMVEGCQDTNDIRLLTVSLKDLPGKMASAGLAISSGDDGIPTVIIRDLSGVNR